MWYYVNNQEQRRSVGRKHVWYLIFAFLCGYVGVISLMQAGVARAASVATTQWASSTVNAPDYSRFDDMASDDNGNVYAVGGIWGTEQHDFGNNVTVSGTSTECNSVIVKYNSAGVAQWAKSTTGSASSNSTFYSVAIDGNGDVYAVGYILAYLPYNFGDGVIVNGEGSQHNLLVIKYNANGVAQWAKSTFPEFLDRNTSSYWDVATDSSNNVYVAGGFSGSDNLNVGDGVVVPKKSGDTVLVVKYSSSGTTQWGKSTVYSPGLSYYFGLATDAVGNIYATGFIRGDQSFDFGDGVTVSGNYSGWYNTIIVKYNSSGVVQWARSTTTAPDDSNLEDITVDGSGNVYAVGYIESTGTFDFGNDVTISGKNTGPALLVLKYNSDGDAQWARSTASATAYSIWSGITSDASGNVYIAGAGSGNEEFDFGNGVTASGAYNSANIMVVKYSSTGEAQWAKTNSASSYGSAYNGVGVDADDNIYVAGILINYEFNAEMDLGDGVTVSGTCSGDCVANALVVKYSETTVEDEDPPGPSLSRDIVYLTLPDYPGQINLEEGQIVTDSSMALRVKPYSEVGISKVDFYVDDSLLCTAYTPDSNGVYSCLWETSERESTVRTVAYNTYNDSATLTRNTTVAYVTTAGTEELTVLPKTGI
jgi:hypothetical protein